MFSRLGVSNFAQLHTRKGGLLSLVYAAKKEKDVRRDSTDFLLSLKVANIHWDKSNNQQAQIPVFLLRDCLNIRQKGQSRAKYPNDKIANKIPD